MPDLQNALSPNRSPFYLRLPFIIAVQAVLFCLASNLAARHLKPHEQDLAIYMRYTHQLLSGQWPYVDFKMEYPLGALLAILLPGLAVFHVADPANFAAIVPAMIAQAAVLCCVTTWIIARIFISRPAIAQAATARFAALTVLLTPIASFRYDTAPMALTAAALWAMTGGRFALCGGFIGLGTLVKAYPLALLPLAMMWLGVRRQWRAIAWMIAGFAVVILLPFAIYAFKSPLAPLSFLKYQTDRGIQLESSWATIALVAGRLFHLRTRVIAEFGAADVINSITSPLQAIQSKAMPLAGLASVAYCGWIAWRVRDQKIDQADFSESPSWPTQADWLCQMFGLVLLVQLLMSRVFSTQYMVWLLPFFVTGSRWRFALLLAASAVTLGVFPFWYSHYGDMSGGKLYLLIARLVLLGVLTVISARWLWVESRPRLSTVQNL